MRLLCSLLLAALCLSAPSHAQPFPVPRGEPATAGVYVPTGVIAGDPDATAVELSPANLGFLRAWNFNLLYTHLGDRGTRGPGGGALFAATPLPYLRSLVVGAGVQLVRPPYGFPYFDQAKFSLALALRLSRTFSVGMTWGHVFSSHGYSDIDTLDIGVAARASRHFALSLVVRDLSAPEVRGVPLQRVYEPELTLRPLGDDRWELGLAARFGERRGDVSPRLRLAAALAPGLLLRASFEWIPDVDGDGRLDHDLRLTCGLQFDFERIGLGGYALFGSNMGDSNLHGYTAALRVSGDRYPSLVVPRRLERVDLGGGGDRQHVALLARLRALERRPRTDGVILVLGNLSGGWARIEELRQAIVRLRSAGRHVYAYGTEITTKSYYVATAAEKLWVDPAGGLRLVGLTSTSLYFRGAFDQFGVRADFVRIAEYKSAPEQYTRTGPTDESRRQRNDILDDIYGRVVAEIAKSRGVLAERVHKLVDSGPYTAVEAAQAGLVDGMKHGDEVEAAISEILGHPVEAVAPDTVPRKPRSFAAPAIGVVHVEGDIIDGKSASIPIIDLKFAGHQTLLEAIVAARSDPRVRALVIRIDSPGGSALASDIIYRELLRTRTLMPVICSFGDTAASGGYFIGAACDKIYASPSTMTGSIGIFTGKFDVAGLAGKLGVSWETYKRGARADMEGYWRPYSDNERALVMDKLKYYYGRFLDAVAAGRKMKKDGVDAVARGHVWTGAQARDRRLVDELGGFLDAVDEARRRAGIKEGDTTDILSFPDEPGVLGQLADLVGLGSAFLAREARGPSAGSGSARAASASDSPLPLTSLLPAGAGEVLRAIPGSLLLSPSTPQARMDHELVVE